MWRHVVTQKGAESEKAEDRTLGKHTPREVEEGETKLEELEMQESNTEA